MDGLVKEFQSASTKGGNDKKNKLRESLIMNIFHGNYDTEEKYEDNTIEFLKQLSTVFDDLNPNKDPNATLEQKGGRSYRYDFVHTASGVKTKLEFKFGTKDFTKLPQFLSLGKPGRFFETPFWDWHYTHYLPKICEAYEEKMPDKTQYEKQVHSLNPKCMIPIKVKYNHGNIGEKAKSISKESISEFLKKVKPKFDLLKGEILKGQDQKTYLMYTLENGFTLQKFPLDKITITKFVRIKNNNTLVYRTKDEGYMNILLRWKNGNGIAYPALQISRTNK